MSHTMEQDVTQHLPQYDLKLITADKVWTNYPRLPNTKILGLGHKARQGKDWVASYIRRNFSSDYDIQVTSFAAALRAVCRAMFGMTKKDAKLLQIVGMDLFRQKDPEVWVRSLYWYLQELQPQVAIIPDVRFPNELQFIKDQGGFACKVERVNEDLTPWVSKDRDPNHPSEIALDGADWDGTITAVSGDLMGLEKSAEDLFLYFEKLHLAPPPLIPTASPRDTKPHVRFVPSDRPRPVVVPFRRAS